MKHLLLILLLFPPSVLAQTGTVRVAGTGRPVPFASVVVAGTTRGATATETGAFVLTEIAAGKVTLTASAIGYGKTERAVTVQAGQETTLTLNLTDDGAVLDEVVVSGTLQPVLRSESPVPVEVLTPTFFKKNPTPCLFEALQNVNDVRP